MRLLPGPSSSSEEVDDSSVAEAAQCRRPSAIRPPRFSPHRPLLGHSRRRFCVGIFVTAVALVANCVLFLVIFDILLALLRRKCADVNGQQNAMEEITQNQHIVVRPTPSTGAETTTANANENNRSTTLSLGPGAVVVSVPPSHAPMAPQNGTFIFPSWSSPYLASSSSPTASTPSSPLYPFGSPFSPSPPPSSTRLSSLTSAGSTTVSKSTSSNPSTSTPSSSTNSPRIRVTSTDRMALARQQKIPSGNAIVWSLPSKEEDHRSSVTLVTALLDIGRDRWRQYGRTMRQYHQFMRNLLQLRVPMVIIVDEKSAQFVHRERARINWGRWTKVVQLALHQLPLAMFQKRISHLMHSELANWPPDWDPSMRSHPEASQAEYVVVVNSKPYFLAQAATDNPFGTEFFAWLDAGYGHGNRAVFPPSWEWHPTFPRGKISVIKLTPPRDLLSRYSLKQLYRRDVAVLSGGFLAGDRRAVTQLHGEHHRMFLELLERGRVDDDQTFLVLLANRNPTMFSIVNGDWFDAFKLF